MAEAKNPSENPVGSFDLTHGDDFLEVASSFIERSVEPNYKEVPAFNAAKSRAFYLWLAKLIGEHHKVILEDAKAAGWDGKVGDAHLANTFKTELAMKLNVVKDASAKYALSIIAKPGTCESMEEALDKACDYGKMIVDRVEQSRKRKRMDDDE